MTRRVLLVALVLGVAVAAIVAGGAGAAAGLTVPSTITAEATGPDGASVTWQATDFDQDNNPIDITCGPDSGQGTLDVTHTYPISDTDVVCTGGQGAQAQQADFHIVVQDTTPPALTLPSSPVTAAATSSRGATVDYSVSATDLVDPSPAVNCAPASGSQFPVGDTGVTCTATDAAHNTSLPASFTVTVTPLPPDTTPPTISNVPAPIVAEATGAGGAMVTYASPTATDDTDGTDPVTCAPTSGSTFALGVTTVTCNASDQAGNPAAPATFTVTVQDTTGPTLTVPNSVTAPATSKDGAVVDYSASVSASDAVDGALTPQCLPASGTLFHLHDTTVTCTATDAHSNQTTDHFTVTVTDTNAPVFQSPPGPLRVEAVGPTGATISYTTPTATDPEDGAIPATCTPPSGHLFPLGATIVGCDAFDAAGNKAHVEFTVTVVDSTPPTLHVAGPTTVEAPSSDGIAASAPSVVAFLKAYLVDDLVDQSPTVTTNAPASFPIGTTTVTFTARDASGNVATRTSTLTVLAPPPPPSSSSSPPPAFSPPPPPPPPVIIPPPPDASSFHATAARGKITLHWTIPSSTAIDHVELLRAQATNGVGLTLVYKGAGTTFVDSRVQDGDTYRYQLVSVAPTGDRSTGVALTATPLSLRLLSPLPGKILRSAPQLRWLRTAKASYYNIQLYRGSVKVMSIWPSAAHYKLKSKWTYLGRKYRLAAGTYEWFVWAGFGARAKQKYSPLLGQSTFTIGR